MGKSQNLLNMGKICESDGKKTMGKPPEFVTEGRVLEIYWRNSRKIPLRTINTICFSIRSSIQISIQYKRGFFPSPPFHTKTPYPTQFPLPYPSRYLQRNGNSLLFM